MSNTVANGFWEVMRYSKTGATVAVLFRWGAFDEERLEWDGKKNLRELLSWGNLRISASAPRQAVDGRGWPAVCMWSEYEPVRNGIVTEVRGGVIVPLASRLHPYLYCSVPRVLPLRPIWPGFAINTVFYAALLWIVTLGPGTARRIIRRKQGRCINCGYDLSHVNSDTCSECGTPIKRNGHKLRADPGADSSECRCTSSRSTWATPTLKLRPGTALLPATLTPNEFAPRLPKLI